MTLTAKVVETASWYKSAKLRGLTLHVDDVQQEGMIVVDTNNVNLSLDRALQRFCVETHKPVMKSEQKKDNTGKEYTAYSVDHWTVQSTLPQDEIRAAVLAAL